MYIVIAGAGLVGGSLAARLVEARHDVVVVDQDPEVCDRLVSRIGVEVYKGSATDIEILEDAGIPRADVAIGTMRADADNLAFSLLAKSLGVPRLVARMRDPRYEAAYKTAGVAATVRIVDVFVNQIMLEIEQPNLRQVATFGKGKASIVVDTIPADAFAAGMTVSQIAANDAFPAECVITGIYRSGNQQFVIPRGSAEILAGDHVFLVASHADLRKASKFLHRKS